MIASAVAPSLSFMTLIYLTDLSSGRGNDRAVPTRWKIHRSQDDLWLEEVSMTFHLMKL